MVVFSAECRMPNHGGAWTFQWALSYMHGEAVEAKLAPCAAQCAASGIAVDVDSGRPEDGFHQLGHHCCLQAIGLLGTDLGLPTVIFCRACKQVMS
eukprot:927677-Pelagomonas_calceolata.AAC.1